MESIADRLIVHVWLLLAFWWLWVPLVFVAIVYLVYQYCLFRPRPRGHALIVAAIVVAAATFAFRFL